MVDVSLTIWFSSGTDQRNTVCTTSQLKTSFLTASRSSEKHLQLARRREFVSYQLAVPVYGVSPSEEKGRQEVEDRKQKKGRGRGGQKLERGSQRACRIKMSDNVGQCRTNGWKEAWEKISREEERTRNT